ncbi:MULTISPECIES: DUF2478 domain-containing protein [Rhodopseudomonas]|uniref:DUF2478 domain-containing protein n=1 Tax=Rhodopseudomonas TaxID=1073 RepID=UPI00069654D7|nr:MULTISPECIES: DUF2478 domain-containing protein [Rhodopseudomonas]MDF3813326.1 DUF2478 domain-containing protein [Rhodopseudomonas sp. BAL398]WOK17209.1 DUF2478 domain-containing protein [Rhodopseudomonas sp. BAL398]
MIAASGTIAPHSQQTEADIDVPFAAMLYDDSLRADAVLAGCMRDLQVQGLRLGGVIQIAHDRPDRHRCDMILHDLFSGDQISISADRGAQARGCKLDLDALAQAAVWMERALDGPLDLMVLNKFGKQEAAGRGLLQPVAEAISRGIPTVAGVSAVNLEACIAFAGGRPAILKPHAGELDAWCRRQVESKLMSPPQ